MIRKQLRYNQYYDIQAVYDRLYRQSINGDLFYSLYNIIVSDKNIFRAYRAIKRNKGSTTPGVNNNTIKDLEKMTSQEILDLVRNRLNIFNPHPVMRTVIKKDDGRDRPLGIPTIEDRLIQQCILQVLEPIVEAKFFPHTYGFRPIRSTKHAIARVNLLINRAGLNYVVDVDVKGFFDNVNHGKLLKQMWTMGIRDKTLLSIISKMLKAPIKGEGIPQAGVPQCYIVRYADDFKILCRNYETAQKIFIAVKNWLKERLKLEISPQKFRITNLRKNYSNFLGIKIKAIKKRNKYVAISHIRDKAKKKIIKSLREGIRAVKKVTNAKIVQKLNSKILGIQNYYSMATRVSLDMNKIGYKFKKSLHSSLGKILKKGEQVNKTYQRLYGRYNYKRYAIAGINIYPVEAVNHRLARGFNQKQTLYTEPGRTIIYQKLKTNYEILRYLVGNPNPKESIEFNDNRITKYLSQYGKCRVTDRPLEIGEMEIHHIQAKKDGGNDRYNNLVYLNKYVHQLIHVTKKETKEWLLDLINLNEKQLAKINSYRRKVGNYVI